MDLRRGIALFSFLLLAVPALIGCAGASGENDGSGTNAQVSETSYCADRPTYPGGVTLTADAEYEYRPLDVLVGLSGNPVSAGIPFAEVRVVNVATGATVQCGETDAHGAISLTLPTGEAQYVLKVFSRSDTSQLKISVNEDYWANQPYEINKSFSVGAADTMVAAGTLTAFARVSDSVKIEGGAFHILSQIYKANEYVRSTTGNSSFVAPKVTVYWKMGHNPYTYFGGTAPLSFYRPGARQLFILGGNNGDVKSADTDHFDNSIILHEYGHFLEDVYAQSDTPGGSHSGNAIIDPRLAWSEGWANFLQAAIQRDSDANWKHYIDTVGFKNDSVEGGTSGSGIGLKIDLTIAGGTGTCTAGSASMCDPVSVAGEGTFREISISRFLFKTLRSVTVPFSTLWSAFTGTDSSGTPVGIASSQVAFRNVGIYNQFLATLIASNHPGLVTSWDALRNEEKQNADTRDYADPVEPAASCAARSISPTADVNGRANLFTANDFYRFDHDGSPKTIRLEYSNGQTSPKHLDLDLYLYREDHVYQETGAASTGGILIGSARPVSLDGGVESISLAGITAGRYLLNVKAYTASKSNFQLNGTMTYGLKIVTGATTEDLCPVH